MCVSNGLGIRNCPRSPLAGPVPADYRLRRCFSAIADSVATQKIGVVPGKSQHDPILVSVFSSVGVLSTATTGVCSFSPYFVHDVLETE